jgi:recombinational DNA repair ATPase RecF
MKDQAEIDYEIEEAKEMLADWQQRLKSLEHQREAALKQQPRNQKLIEFFDEEIVRLSVYIKHLKDAIAYPSNLEETIGEKQWHLVLLMNDL